MSVHVRVWSWRRMRFVCGRCGFGWQRRRRRCLDEPLRMVMRDDAVYLTGIPEDSPLRHWPMNLSRSHTFADGERR